MSSHQQWHATPFGVRHGSDKEPKFFISAGVTLHFWCFAFGYASHRQELFRVDIRVKEGNFGLKASTRAHKGICVRTDSIAVRVGMKCPHMLGLLNACS